MWIIETGGKENKEKQIIGQEKQVKVKKKRGMGREVKSPWGPNFSGQFGDIRKRRKALVIDATVFCIPLRKDEANSFQNYSVVYKQAFTLAFRENLR